MKCERCGDEFKVPPFAIDSAYARWCLRCLKLGWKAYAKLSIKQVIENQVQLLIERIKRKEVRDGS